MAPTWSAIPQATRLSRGPRGHRLKRLHDLPSPPDGRHRHPDPLAPHVLEVRKHPRDYDRYVYKQRHLVGSFISWATHFRRAAARHENTARNFLALWNFVAIIKLLKQPSTRPTTAQLSQLRRVLAALLTVLPHPRSPSSFFEVQRQSSQQ